MAEQGRWQDAGWSIERSRLHDRTWVPVASDTDITPMLHAGPLARVKEWVRVQCTVEQNGAPVRFRKDYGDSWAVEVKL